MATVVESFTTGEAAALANMERATLAYWCRPKRDGSTFFRASLQQAKGLYQGRGHGHLFDLRDVARLRAIVRLRDQGVSLQRLGRIGEYLREAKGWENPKVRAWLVVAGDDVLLCESGDLTSVLQRQRVLAFVMDLETAREVRQAAESLRRAA